VAGHLFSRPLLASFLLNVTGNQLVPAVHLSTALFLQDVLPSSAWWKLFQSLLESLLDFGRPNSLTFAVCFTVGTAHHFHLVEFGARF